MRMQVVDLLSRQHILDWWLIVDLIAVEYYVKSSL